MANKLGECMGRGLFLLIVSGWVELVMAEKRFNHEVALKTEQPYCVFVSAYFDSQLPLGCAGK